MKNIRKIVAVVGPTASGKTGLGVAIAKKYSAKGRPASGWDGAEIISADSRQVFRGLDIGTGKDLKEYGDIKYHLIDICDLGEPFTMFDWLEKARAVIEDIFSRGKLPVIVGGTGLYVQALVEGFRLEPEKSQIINRKSQTPLCQGSEGQTNSKSKIKNYTREQLDAMSLEKLQSIFEKLKAKSYQLSASDIQNPRRLIRAIEKAQTGSISAKVKPDFDVLQIALDFSREVLYERIDRRAEEWFEYGFYEEVENLLKSGIKKEWFELIGLEYKILANYICCHSRPEAEGYPLGSGSTIVDPRFNGNDSQFEQMKQEMKYKIHNFARRQLTWFRRFPEIVWIKDKKEAFVAIDDFLK